MVIGKNKKRKLITLSLELEQALEAEATAQSRSVSNMIIAILNDYFFKKAVTPKK